MTRQKQTLRWVIAAVAIVAAAGITDAALAKKNTKEKTTSSAKASSGYLGVYMQDLSDDVRKGLDLDVKKGVLVSGVEEDAPAEIAGIEEGDVITRFNGETISSPEELRRAVGAVTPGTDAELELVRDGKTQTMTVTVGERPARRQFGWIDDESFAPMQMARGLAMFGPRLGVQAQELDDDNLASYFGTKKGDGLLVLSVDEESRAGKAGVKPGDVIRRVGDEKIAEVSDVRDALHELDEGDEFDITVLRHGKEQALKATMDQQPGEFAFRAPRGEGFRWYGHRAPEAHREWMRENRDDLRRELDNLKRELRELKEELGDRNDG